MTKEIVGDKKLLTESNRDDFCKKLDEVMKNLLVPEPKISNNIEDILSLTYQQLKEVSTQEALIFSYQLKQYSFYVQMKENRFKNIERWASESLRSVFGKLYNNYGTQYTKYEEKKEMIIADNAYANGLHNIVIQAGAQAKELESLSYKLVDLAKTLSEIGFNKRKENND